MIKRTISGRNGKGSLAHNRRAFETEVLLVISILFLLGTFIAAIIASLLYIY